MEFNCLEAAEPLLGDRLLLPLSPQEFLVLIWLTLEGRKVESTSEQPSGFEPEAPGLRIHHINPKTIEDIKKPEIPLTL